MKGAWFQRFAQLHLLPYLDGFIAKGKFLFKTPVGMMFRGFIFDSSGFSKEGPHPQAFVQPLYVPESYAVLTFAQRFSGGWDVIGGEEKKLAVRLLAQIHSVGLPFLEVLETPEKLAHPPSRWESFPNVHVQRAIGYSLALVSEDGQAREKIKQACEQLEAGGIRYAWEKELLEELLSFEAVLSRDPQRARRQLSVWAEETRRKLRLPE